MRNIFEKLKNNAKSNLKIGIIVSLILLILFLLIQYHYPRILELDIKWIILALIPIVLSLIYSGKITGIKALGLELKVEPSRVNIADLEEKIEFSISKEEKIYPVDYFYLNHTSFFRKDKQKELQNKTGIHDVKLYDVRIKIFSYYSGALEEVEKVQYFLHNSYENPVREVYDSKTNFELKELAFGEYVLSAKIYIRNVGEPFIVQRYISLWDSNPRI